LTNARHATSQGNKEGMVFKAGPMGVGYYREGHPANGGVKSLDELSARELKSRLDALDVDYSTALDKQELRRLISQVRLGLGRIVALYYRSSTSYQIH
jgi:hypothetical protein